MSDAIGQTVYSKQWLIQGLMKLIKFVENESNRTTTTNIGDNESTMAMNDGDNVEFDEDQLCLIWDISSDSDVQQCLIELNAADIFIQTIISTENQRLAEIAIGILGNLCHNDQICNQISTNSLFCSNALSMLAATDIPFLIQLIRFLNTGLNKQPNKWLPLIHEQNEFFNTQIEYLLANCLNRELLRLLLQYLNDVLYQSDEELAGNNFFNNDSNFIIALCQACMQILSEIDQQQNDNQDTESIQDVQFFYNFWFILEMITRTIDDKIVSDCFDDIMELFLRFVNGKSFLDFSKSSSSSSNSINAFSAACACLYRLMMIQNDENISQIFREKMATIDDDDDRLKSIFNKSMSAILSDQHNWPTSTTIHHDTSILRNIYENIDHLYRYLFSSSSSAD
uniref:Protein saal1-like n=1 Tax=Dermatophagoides pteronyssinus TaxID=6956 RepID=A0A6P6Y2U6_DERPT|nr:protein saal1-like [Dermatophagoides pteronyssinus]